MQGSSHTFLPLGFYSCQFPPRLSEFWRRLFDVQLGQFHEVIYIQNLCLHALERVRAMVMALLQLLATNMCHLGAELPKRFPHAMYERFTTSQCQLALFSFPIPEDVTTVSDRLIMGRSDAVGDDITPPTPLFFCSVSAVSLAQNLDVGAILSAEARTWEYNKCVVSHGFEHLSLFASRTCIILSRGSSFPLLRRSLSERVSGGHTPSSGKHQFKHSTTSDPLHVLPS